QGPLFAQLQKGNNIRLEDGTIVKPSQVLGPARTGAPVVIVDCPSLDLLPSLVSNPAWERLYSNSNNNCKQTATNTNSASNAAFVVHMAPAEVLRSAEYAGWARRFGPRAKHLVTTQPFCSPHTIFQ
ncbi:unnamed protein product, partial [Hapterophycus canaliculatus]